MARALPGIDECMGSIWTHAWEIKYMKGRVDGWIDVAIVDESVWRLAFTQAPELIDTSSQNS